MVAADSYDLVIVGAGSGNTLPADQFAGWRIAVVEADLFGGTCLNRGCVPSKMLVYTADVAQMIRSSRRCASGTQSTRWPPAFSTSIQHSPKSSSRHCSSSEAVAVKGPGAVVLSAP